MSIYKNHNQTINGNQDGFASLVIGLILVIVLSLMTVSFAVLSRHEQQSALNSQLATQAYYAAESGVNDATKLIASGNPIPNVDTGKCIGSPVTIGPATNSVGYTCVSVTLNSQDIFIQNIAPREGHSFVTATSSPLNTLTFAWGNSLLTNINPRTTVSPVIFDDGTNWTSPAVIQLSITPLSGGYARSNLISDTYSVVLYPSQPNLVLPTAVFSASSNNQGKIVSGNCSASNRTNSGTLPTNYNCSTTINMSAAGPGPYLIHFINEYATSNVDITGKDAGNAQVTFSGSQATIDSTGKAKDVLKRIQVRVPLNSEDEFNYAIEAQNVCKRIVTSPNNTTFISSTSSTSDPCQIDN